MPAPRHDASTDPAAGRGTGASGGAGPSGGTGRARRRAQDDGSQASSHLERSPTWAGLRSGEEVRVDGARQRGASWTFVAHVRNTRTGEEWVEVAGGRPGNHAVRSFRPEQIFPASSRARRGAGGGTGPSLSEAPRLPF